MASAPMSDGKFRSFAQVTSVFCCPNCGHEPLDWNFGAREELPSQGEVTCAECRQVYLWKDGILDFVGEGHRETITPFQRLMQLTPIAAIYEKYWRPAGYFLASFSSFGRFSEQLIGLVDPYGQRIILDLACGPGLFTCPLAQRTSGWVIGLDLSLPMLHRARRKAAIEGVRNILLVRGSAFRLPFRAGCFDTILCSGALHLFDRPESTLKEIARTLSPNGRFVCQTTLRPRRSLGGAWLLDRIIRFGFFKSPEDLNEKLKTAGIIVQEAWSQRIAYLFLAHRR
jgi:ubiquinone/menaquinone biosynthesis C-methylase UbiE